MKPLIVLHGGAGTVPSRLRENARIGIEKAKEVSWKILESGGSALDAVEAAVREMENFHQFNAGYGSVMTEDGKIEMDALLMDGKTRNIGGVIGVSRVKNPISLSRLILDNSPHVIFAGEGAEKFAKQQNMELIDPETLITDRIRERLQKFHKTAGGYESTLQSSDPERRDKYGTVGAVARDIHGNFAAATSTGGVLGKKSGRVGDTPLVGAGTYADTIMAFSATGVGEYIIRSMLGMEVLSQLKSGKSAVDASKVALELMKHDIGGEAGLILVTKDGWAAEKTTEDLIFAVKSEDTDYNFTQV